MFPSHDHYFFDGGRTNGEAVEQILANHMNDEGAIWNPIDLANAIRCHNTNVDIHYRETFMWIKQAVKRYRKLTGENPPADVILGNLTRRKVGKDVYPSTISESDADWFKRLVELDDEYAEEGEGK